MIETKITVRNKALGFLDLFKTLAMIEGLYLRERARDFKQSSSLKRLEGSEEMCKIVWMYTINVGIESSHFLLKRMIRKSWDEKRLGERLRRIF